MQNRENEGSPERHTPDFPNDLTRTLAGEGNFSQARGSVNGDGNNTGTSANDRHDYRFDQIPASLKDLPQWGVWRREYTDGKPGNVPYDAKTGNHLSVADSGTWSPFDVALEAYQRGIRGQWDGLSVALKEGGQTIGLDVDECVDEHGDLTPEAQKIVTLWGSYLEYSPSRRGLRGFAFGTLPEGRRKVGHYEIYDSAKVLTVTGWHLSGSPTTLETRPDAIREIHTKFFSKPKKQPTTGTFNPEDYEPLSDDDVIDLATRAKNGAWVQALIDGDFSGYASTSEAELALCNYFAFYCGPNSHEQIDRMMRHHLTADRLKKWDKRHHANGDTYGQRTVQVALEGRTEFYMRPRTKAGIHDEEAGIAALVAAEMDGTTGAFRLTDLGNGERFVFEHGADFRYCPPWKKWLGWDGTRWLLDDAQTVRKRGRATVRGMYTAVKKLVDRMGNITDSTEKAQLLKQQTQLLKHAVQSENAKRVGAMLDLAQMDLTILPKQFDTDLWALNVENGTIDLRSGDLRPHMRTDLLTKCVPLVYDPDATCPLWEQFLSEIMGGNDDLVDFLWKAMGYSLTGDVREDCLFLLYGRGRNGKTTFIETTNAVLGDYATTAAFSTFLHQERDSVRNDIADLQGARFVSAVEADQGKRLSEALIKRLTGKDTMKARFLFQEYFQFKPQLKLWLATNHKPVIQGTDDGIWLRLRLIPFTQKFEGTTDDKHLGDKLKTELPGILAWIVRGCLAWQAEGLPLPDTIKNATGDYRKEMDVLGNFLDECCEQKPHLRVKAGDLYNAYVTWSGDKFINQTAFGRSLTERGIGREKRGPHVWRLGITLSTEEASTRQ